MKVRELIAMLGGLDPELEVWGYEAIEIDAARFTHDEVLMTADSFEVRDGRLWIDYPFAEDT